MPTYEYQCTRCEHRFEVFQRITEEPIKTCERCDAPVRRVLFPVGIVFKGPGFYVNDYGKSNGSSSGGNGRKSTETPKKEESTPA